MEEVDRILLYKYQFLVTQNSYPVIKYRTSIGLEMKTVLTLHTVLPKCLL
jgi:hypothetical protein